MRSLKSLVEAFRPFAPTSGTGDVYYRIPVALKPILEEMARKYRQLVDENEVDDPALIETVINAINAKQTSKNIDSEKIEKAIEILNEALTLKVNSGGAIKRKIEKALQLMH